MIARSVVFDVPAALVTVGNTVIGGLARDGFRCNSFPKVVVNPGNANQPLPIYNGCTGV